MIHFEVLCEKNVDSYIRYLEKALREEPDKVWIEKVDPEAIRSRVQDSFYQNTTSILAMEGEETVGRIEYHFYGCLQDGYRMAYVDWVYVLREVRRQNIGRRLFKEFEKECRKYKINQYFLIMAESEEAVRFYESFSAKIEKAPTLRKDL